MRIRAGRPGGEGVCEEGMGDVPLGGRSAHGVAVFSGCPASSGASAACGADLENGLDEGYDHAENRGEEDEPIVDLARRDPLAFLAGVVELFLCRLFCLLRLVLLLIPCTAL